MNRIPIGYKAITEKLRLETIPHFRESYIALHGRGQILIENDHEIHIYPKSYALKNANDLLENLEFALKYDGINLEIIKAFFEKTKKSQIITYIKKHPTGIYARKIWYLYELLIQQRLSITDAPRIKHVDLLDPKKYFTGPTIKSARHRINDNLLGNHQFCPVVRRTKSLEQFINLDLANKVRALLKRYDPHLIARACHYLYTKETMSSYEIEKEKPEKNRVFRFINLLQKAPYIDSLSKEVLIELQNEIVDPRFKDTDFRHRQNYVGENINPYFQRIHYISPKPDNISDMMEGLLKALERMQSGEVYPVLIAATISFGFVFIHPFEDGNGRLHRFLIHQILSKNNFTPKEIIFPVSSVMLQNLHEYDAILESFSKPLLRVLTNYDLSDDGILTVKQDTKSYYLYIDYTKIVEYLFKCILDAIHNQIELEIKFLINYDKTKSAIQELIDLPDHLIDLFIKFVIQNNGSLSLNKRSKYFPSLRDPEISDLTKIINHFMLDKS